MPIDQHGDAVIEGVSIRSLPKVSLHDHLDGGVRPATIIELGGEIAVSYTHLTLPTILLV